MKRVENGLFVEIIENLDGRSLSSKKIIQAWGHVRRRREQTPRNFSLKELIMLLIVGVDRPKIINKMNVVISIP